MGEEARQIVDAYEPGHPCPEGLVFAFMKLTIDDLPMVKVSSLLAHGLIGPETKTTLIRFDGSEVEYQVGVTASLFRAAAAGRCSSVRGAAGRPAASSARRVPACGACVRASGLIYRSQSVRTEKRHLVTAPPRIALLRRDTPMRVNSRPNRVAERRVNAEIALRRSLIVARKHGVDRAKDRGLT